MMSHFSKNGGTFIDGFPRKISNLFPTLSSMGIIDELQTDSSKGKKEKAFSNESSIGRYYFFLTQKKNPENPFILLFIKIQKQKEKLFLNLSNKLI